MLIIDNLSFFRGEKVIFKNLALSVSTSSAIVITGKNGCGKSSLLKIIAGIYECNNGKIFWGNENIKDIREDFNGDLQYLGHKNFLKPELTILENINFYSKIHDTQMAISSALNYFELSDYQNILVKNLSAGWQQRVLLAKLMACPATIWLLDEPSNHLDSYFKEKLKELIKIRIKDRGLILVVSHDEYFFDLGAKLNLEDFV
ncbi:MAG: heme ABC exporter ATP-binding protein CcmA [Alphaproteobacteria bacterium]